MLEFLESSGVARCIYERVSTLGQLEDAIDDWAPRKQHPLCYLALHGSPDTIYVGRHEMSLEDLLLIDHGDNERAVNLRGKVLFLASCSTLTGDRRKLRKVVKDTKLNTLCGYGGYVEWFEAAAFDLLALSALCGYDQASSAVKYLRREHGGFVRRMRFRSEPNWTS